MSAYMSRFNSRRFVAPIAIALLLIPTSRLIADVVTVGAVSPIPPAAGGTSSAQLIVGNGTDDTSNNIWGLVSVDDGTLLQYGSLIVGDNENFYGEVNVAGNFQGGPITQLNFSALGSTSNPTVQVGNEGTGYLNVSGGSRMTLTNQDGDMAIGLESTGVGYVNITDPFTLLTVPETLVVGQSGFGSLNILNRAIVRTLANSRSNYISIGRNVGGVGNVVVDGLGSILNTASSLRVGESGQGSLTITDGAMVNVIDGGTPLLGPPQPFMSIGTNATGVGNVAVDGVGSRLLVRRDLQIGVLGQGSLSISDGGLVQILDNPAATSTILVGPYGRIDLDGGTLAGTTPDATPPPGMPATFGTNLQGFLGGSGLVRGTVQVGENAFVEAEAGELLRFEGAVSNQGAVTIDGGEIQFNKQFSNNAAAGAIPPGRISVENAGTVRFRELLTNNGVLSSAHGATNIHGEIDNPGNIVVARDTVATFYDLVNNTGTITVKPGGNASLSHGSCVSRTESRPVRCRFERSSAELLSNQLRRRDHVRRHAGGLDRRRLRTTHRPTAGTNHRQRRHRRTVRFVDSAIGAERPRSRRAIYVERPDARGPADRLVVRFARRLQRGRHR